MITPATRRLRFRLQKRDGAVLVLVALGLLAFMGLAAMAIDWAILYNTRQTLQEFTEAGALAGAQELADATSAKMKAAEYYALNLSASSPPKVKFADSAGDSTTFLIGGDIVTVTTPYAKEGSSDPADQFVHVEACRVVDYMFARVLGYRQADVCARATAEKSKPRSGLIVLDPLLCGAVNMTGPSSLLVTNGTVYVNSACPDSAIRMTGPSRIRARITSVTGGVNTDRSDAIDPPAQTGQPPVPDPLAALPAPSKGGLHVFSGGTFPDGTVLSPGVYSGTIKMTGGGTIVFLPGVYILQDGMTLTGASRVTGSEVFVYNEGGAITFTGGSTVRFSPPRNGTYQGISFFQARSNTDAAKFTGGADGSGWAEGMFYLPNAELSLTGNANFPKTFLIVNNIKMTGSSAIIGADTGPAGEEITLVE
jgi:hypothetical protein